MSYYLLLPLRNNLTRLALYFDRLMGHTHADCRIVNIVRHSVRWRHMSWPLYWIGNVLDKGWGTATVRKTAKDQALRDVYKIIYHCWLGLPANHQAVRDIRTRSWETILCGCGAMILYEHKAVLSLSSTMFLVLPRSLIVINQEEYSNMLLVEQTTVIFRNSIAYGIFGRRRHVLYWA